MPLGVELLLRADGVSTNLDAIAKAHAAAGRPAGERCWLRGEGLDAITMAAALAPQLRTALGVVVDLDREPSVLARDLTTLSHLCPDGLAVALRTPAAEAGRLEEFVAVLRAMFSSEETTLEFGGSKLVATPNRPLPLQPGGPEIWIDTRLGASAVAGVAQVIAKGDLVELEA